MIYLSRAVVIQCNALAAISGCGKSDNKGNGSDTDKPDHTDAECWKCRNKGHIRMNCHLKKKKEKTESGKGKDTVNTATGGEEFTFTTTFTGATLTHVSNPLARIETNVTTQAHFHTCHLHMTSLPPSWQSPPSLLRLPTRPCLLPKLWANYGSVSPVASPPQQSPSRVFCTAWTLCSHLSH